MSDGPARCRACGQLLPPSDRPVVDLDENSIRFRDRIAYLTPREAEIAAVLMAGPISFRELVARVWGRYADISRSVPKVYLSRLRRKLKPLGLAIRGRGWRSLYSIEVDSNASKCSL